LVEDALIFRFQFRHHTPRARVADTATQPDGAAAFRPEGARHAIRMKGPDFAGGFVEAGVKMRRVDAVKRPVGYADLQRMPDDGNRYELYDGELWMVPSPLPIHQAIVGRLHLALSATAKTNGGAVYLAPFDIVLSEYNVVQPDLIFFGPESARRIRPREHVRFPPDAAFEVLSPSTARNDRGRKRRLLAQYRVPEYWIIDPDASSVEVSRLVEGGYAGPVIASGGRCGSSVIRGFELDLAELFGNV
jgi:Uma2 family endonuclease